MQRTDIINSIIKARGFRRYLEIGVENGYCFEHIVCEEKVGVDPDPIYDKDVMRLESDDFFRWYSGPQFDIVFVDGLHTAEQFLRDVENSLRILSPGGVIVCHDTMPPNEEMQSGPPRRHMWTGDVWKGVLRLRSVRRDISLFTFDTDFGVTVIERGEPDVWQEPNEVDWQYYLENSSGFLNVKPPEYLDEWLRK